MSQEELASNSIVTSDEDWEEFSDELLLAQETENALPVVFEKKRKRTVMSKHETDRKQELIKSTLQHQFQRLYLVSSWSFADETVAAVSSLVPADFQQIAHLPSKTEIIDNLVAWFRLSFKIVDNKHVSFSEGRDGCAWADGLDRVLSKGAGTSHQLLQIFVALMSGLGVPVRYVCTVDPAPPGVEEISPLVWAEVALCMSGSSGWVNVDPCRN
jgi:hypothetical protein